ncbi:G5 domain-containing protein [Hutsoniella sourekii]|uniref:G5 domain-containing protein n=1 Tax=Hutsoniella sourekii TaxID=87650 RepID=UPI000480FA97|nr:G5 domain-containing protein [Hutsoniella sourekii]
MKKYLLKLSSLTLVASLALAPVTTLAEEIFGEDLTEEVFDWDEEDSNHDVYFEDIPEEPTEEGTDEESLDMHMARVARPEEDDEEDEDNVQERVIVEVQLNYEDGSPVGEGFILRLNINDVEATTDTSGIARFELDPNNYSDYDYLYFIKGNGPKFDNNYKPGFQGLEIRNIRPGSPNSVTASIINPEDEGEFASMEVEVTYPDGTPVEAGITFRLKRHNTQAETDENGFVTFDIDMNKLKYGNEAIYFVHGNDSRFTSDYNSGLGLLGKEVNDFVAGKTKHVKLTINHPDGITIPFKTVRQEDPSLEVGVEKVIQEGVNGLKDFRGNIIKEPIDEIIAVGTKPIHSESISSEPESESTPNPDSSSTDSQSSSPSNNNGDETDNTNPNGNSSTNDCGGKNSGNKTQPKCGGRHNGGKNTPKRAKRKPTSNGKVGGLLPDTGEDSSVSLLITASLTTLAGLGLAFSSTLRQD